MSELACAVPVSDSPAEHHASPAVQAGDHVGAVRVLARRDRRIDLRIPGELGWGRALIGLVPVVWCAAAWMLCLRENLLAERMRGCVALTLMAAVSVILMCSSLGVTWSFDGRRRRIARRVGLLGRSHNARRIAALHVESTRASALSDVLLRLTLVDATGGEQFEIATWSRREIDRAQVDALACAIRQTMDWPAEDC